MISNQILHFLNHFKESNLITVCDISEINHSMFDHRILHIYLYINLQNDIRKANQAVIVHDTITFDI